MTALMLREPRETDWPAILGLANASVAGVPGAGLQDDWAENRRRFDHARGTQRQLVAVDEATRSIVGYAAVESAGSDAPGAFRLFLVTAPEQLPRIGEILYQNLIAVLREIGAREVRFQEYASDAPLLAFARARGFVERHRFAIDEGVEIVQLARDLDRAA
jgi:hypothetical protein